MTKIDKIETILATTFLAGVITLISATEDYKPRIQKFLNCTGAIYAAATFYNIYFERRERKK